jgi:hypothetical protein
LLAHRGRVNFLAPFIADHLLEDVILDKEVSLLIYELANFFETRDRHEKVAILNRVLEMLLQVAPNLFAESSTVE